MLSYVGSVNAVCGFFFLLGTA